MPVNITAIAALIAFLFGGWCGYQWNADTVADLELKAVQKDAEWLAESSRTRAELQAVIDRGYTKYAAEKGKVEDKANALKDALSRDDSALSGLLTCQADLREASDTARLDAEKRAARARKAQADLIDLAKECDLDRSAYNALIDSVK